MAITVKHNKVSTIPDGDDTSVVRPSDWNADHTLTGTVPVANGGTGAATLTGYVYGNGTSAMTAATTIPNTSITGLGTASTKDAGVANGVATLDSGGTVPLSQLPPLGDLNYQGAWNANTNTPTLTSSVGTKGYYYVVSVAGTTNLNGITDWQVGDWAVFNGSVWQKIDNTDAVTSVNGYTGTVVLNATDVGAVSSVSGTAPVSVATGTTTPVVSLAASYGDTQNPYASKTANYVLAAPNGSAGVPTFRALVSADIPTLGTYIPYTNASSAIDLNAQTVTNIAHLGLNSTAVPDILFRAYGDNNSTSRIAIRGYSSNASSSSIRVAKFRGTYASPQAPLSGDSLGKFELAGYGTTSSSGYPQASYEGVTTENWGATARGTKSLFYVTPNTTITQAVALTLDQDKSATFAGALSVTGHTTFEGVTSTGATGTGKLVYDTSPSLVTPLLGTPTSGNFSTGTFTWPTFNQNTTGSAAKWTTARTESLTGDITGSTTVDGSANWSIATTLATVNSNVGVFTNASVTVNGKGLVTAVSSGTAPVTSVTGTAPVVSSGGTTPAISMPAATTSVSGYLTSTDWNTFNSKGSGTVTSVSGTTGRITSTGGTTPVIDLASGVATAGTTGSSSLIPVVTIDTYGRVTSITTASNPQGTVTSVGGTGTVSGISLSGTVTSSGNLTLGGTLDLSSPPAIGGTAAAAITGTTITATKFVGVSGGTF